MSDLTTDISGLLSKARTLGDDLLPDLVEPSRQRGQITRRAFGICDARGDAISHRHQQPEVRSIDRSDIHRKSARLQRRRRPLAAGRAMSRIPSYVLT